MAAAVPDVISLLKQVNASPDPWYAATHLVNVFFSKRIHKAHQKQFAFSQQGQQYSFTLPPQGYINPPALYPNLAHRDLDPLSLPKVSHCSIILMILH